MIVEACLPWTPIPKEFSGNWQVDVVRLEEGFTTEWVGRSTRVSLAVAAYSEPTPERPREDRAWRLDFASCCAYRRRIIGYDGAAPLTQPESKSSAAFWEISPSRFIVESGVEGAYSHATFHHYVIVAAIFDVYEFVATGWKIEPLPDEWAHPFSNKPFPRW